MSISHPHTNERGVKYDVSRESVFFFKLFKNTEDTGHTKKKRERNRKKQRKENGKAGPHV